MRGLEHGDEIRDDERAVAWFYRVLRNAIADHWRSGAARERTAEAFAREPPAAETAGAEAELCRCFEELLPTLKPEHAEMLRRVDLEGARPVDVAARSGISPNLAMVRLHRARRALRQRLTEVCRTCAEHGCLDCGCRPSRATV